jgi:hypothetical protein
MSASIDNHAPELSGLLAAKSGFGLVEGAFVPASRRLAPAALWLIAAMCLGALAAGAGLTAAEDPPAIAAMADGPAAPEPAVSVAAPAPAPLAQARPAPLTEARPVPAKNPRVLPVVLRGQPSRMGGRS